MKKFIFFILVAYASAFFAESLPRWIRQSDEQVIDFIGMFMIWYGTVFSISYFFLKGRAVQQAVIFGIIFGILAETFYFKKMDNIFSFIVFFILYGGMFYVPFKYLDLMSRRGQLNKSI